MRWYTTLSLLAMLFSRMQIYPTLSDFAKQDLDLRDDVEQFTLPISPPVGYTFEPIESIGLKRNIRLTIYRNRCKIIPHGHGKDDSGQIHSAVKRCGTNGLIEFPSPYVYTIAKRLYMKLNNTRVNIYGTLLFTDDLGYWINNSHRIEYQNQSTAWIVEANNSIIDGGGFNKGGINGNGQVWYTHSKGLSNRFGRPISLTFYQCHNTVLQNFAIRQPQFWAIYTQDSTNLTFNGLYINGTNHDPNGNSSNYNINIDGFNAVRTDGIVAKDWIFQGGDDCFSLKGNTSNVYLYNISCAGGSIAFGSLGQYPESPDFVRYVHVENVIVKQARSIMYGGASIGQATYFKSWVGKHRGIPPQGGGGGKGHVSNIYLRNIIAESLRSAVEVNACYHKVSEQANYCHTSKIIFENIQFDGIYGKVDSSFGINLNCSSTSPCRNFKFTNINLSTLHGKKVKHHLKNVINVTGLINEI